MSELQTVWGWQPALYLFLGGLSAGTFIVAALLFLQDKIRNARAVCIASWAALACLALGLVLLLAELSNPLRGMMMWQSFSNITSWMAIGAWALFAAMVVFGVMAVLSTPKLVKLVFKGTSGKAERIDTVRRVAAIAGMVLAFIVAAYTGVLLMAAPGVPLWHTALLPCLFVISGLDTGIALVEIIAVAVGGIAEKSRQIMLRGVVALVLAEMVVLAAFLAMPAVQNGTTESAFAAISVELIATGTLAAPFWALVVVCGLCAPLGAALVGLRRSKPQDSAAEEAARAVAPSHGLQLLGACGALAGGCALRFVVLFAGLHADAVAALVSTL